MVTDGFGPLKVDNLDIVSFHSGGDVMGCRPALFGKSVDEKICGIL